jgi:ribonuclease P protein component
MARLVSSADFERVLGSRSRAATAHFAVHHLPMPAGDLPEATRSRPPTDLSTDSDDPGACPVDDFPLPAPRRLGAVVPKRHARRAVTRSLLKRQIYAAGDRHEATIGRGLWIVRLRAPFDRTRYPSAASLALRRAARDELDELFRAAGRRDPS